MTTFYKRLDEEVQVQQANEEMEGNEDKEELDGDGDDEDEDEEVEIDDDNVEEELDPNEAFQVDGEDVNVAAQPCSHTDNDNISKNYLQELFGSFPFGEVGAHGLQDADISDGEYPIYEQFSEGNCSDDDDY